MYKISDQDYITVNKEGTFVGGTPATEYLGEQIEQIDYVREYFVYIQQLNPDVAALHVLSSETYGENLKKGNPSSEKHGPNAWCRAEFNDGETTSWLHVRTYGSVAICARLCAYYCVSSFYRFEPFRELVLDRWPNIKSEDKKGNTMDIKEVVRAPYIFPDGVVRAIKCYPDAQTYIINGKKVGYSAKEQTLIVPLDVPEREIEEIKEKISRIIESSKKVANTAVNNNAQER